MQSLPKDNLHPYGTSNLYRSFIIKADYFTLESRLSDFSTYSGYMQINGRPIYKFQRGKKWATWYSNNPVKLYSMITITITPKDDSLEGIIKLEVDTSGQLTTKEDVKFWNNELTNLISILSGDKLIAYNPNESGKQIVRSFNRSVYVLLMAVPIFVLFVTIGILWVPFSWTSWGFIIVPILFFISIFISRFIFSRVQRRIK